MTGDNRVGAVVGNGVIGHGIAEVMAKAGWTIHLIGKSEASLGRSMGKIRASLAEFVDAGLLNAQTSAAALARIVPHTDIARAASAELIFEAVPEDMDLKRKIFETLDALCASDAILASSSGHPASELDAQVLKKERVVAAHFWYPPQLLPLVEVCGSPRTSPAVIARLCRELKSAGKEPVVINREIPGFIGNRIQFAALREAWSLWSAGVATAEAIDSVVRHSIGRRLAVTGPIESADLGGLETMVQFARFLQPSLDISAEPPSEIQSLVEAGHRGVATGCGVRDWSDGKGEDLMLRRRRELMRWLKVAPDGTENHQRV